MSDAAVRLGYTLNEHIARKRDRTSISADGYEAYERAMTAKLLRDLEPSLMAGLLLAKDGA